MKLQVVRGLAIACVAVLTASGARAQETINHASVSGRVVDPQGAVVSGAHVYATADRHQSDGRNDDRRERPLSLRLLEGWSVRSLRARRRLRRQRAPSAPHARLGVRSAVQPEPRHARYARHRQRRCGRARHRAQPDRRHGAAGRDRKHAAERQELPRSRAADPRGVADQHRQHAAVRRDVSRARPGPLDQQPAQPVQQLHRGRPFGERRRGGAERDPVRRGRHRPVPGRHVWRPGRARTSARRLRQRRHAQRHEPGAWHRVRLLARRQPQCGQRAVGHDAADGPAAVRRQPRRPDSTEPHVLLRELRAAAARSVRADDDRGGERAAHQREAERGGLSRAAGDDRRLPEPVAQREPPRQGRSPDQQRRSVHGALRALSRHV